MKTIKSILIATVFLVMACNSAPNHVNDIEGTWEYEKTYPDGNERYLETYKIGHIEGNRFNVDIRKFFDAVEDKDDNDRYSKEIMVLNEDQTILNYEVGGRKALTFSSDYNSMKNRDGDIFKKIEE